MVLKVRGLDINYIYEGEGDVTIVLLHGWGANIQVYRRIIDIAKAKYRVIALDFPGFGESLQPDTPWNVDDYVDFTLDFLSNFPLNRVILVGHSFGCRVIAKLLNRNGLSFVTEKVIIIDGAGIKAPIPITSKLRIRAFKTGKFFCKIPVVKHFFPDALDSLQKFFGSADYGNASPIMRQTLVRVVNEDLTHLFPNITQETLLIWGEQDDATPLSDGEKLEKLMPDAGLATIKNAGHFSFLDQPYVFDKIFKTYLKINDM